MKKISFAVIALLLMLCVFAFTACNGGSGDSGESSDSRPELTLTTNIEGAGTVTGGGHFDYNEDLFINAEVNNGYHFLGWYHDNDLLSTSAEYNCKMWDKDVTLEAKFIALPDDYDEEFGDMSPDELINRTFNLSVVAGMPNYGKISVNDGGNKDKYSSSEKSGTNVKALALTTSSKRFLGWFDEAGNLVMSNGVFNFAMPSFDYTLTAKWECNCEYKYNGGNKTYACDACGASYSISELADKDGFVILNNELVAYIGGNTEITIPNNVTTIGSDVFSGNEEITSVNIPSNIKNIASNAFVNCTSIRTITFADGATVNEIGTNAFKNCSALTSIIIPNSVNIIGDAILSGCSSLQSVEIPFRGSSIYSSEIKLGDIFGTQSYSGSKHIKQNTMPYYIPTTLKSVTVNGGVIGESAFENCDMLTQIIINASITTIPKDSFNTCSSLKEFTIPEGVTHIESYAFSKCTSLKELTIPEGVTHIESCAFYKCTSLKTIFIPSTIQNISSHAFGECTALETINYPGSELQWSLLEKEEYWAGFKGTYTIKYGQQSEVVKYSEGLSFSLSDDSKFYIVEGIGDCTDENIVVPVSYKGLIVRKIGDYAFKDCHSIKSITLHDGIKSIGYSSIAWCDSLTNVTLGNGLTSIGDNAFTYCPNLTYNEYNNAYYLGNETNPYVLLVTAKNKSITSATVHNNTRFINDYAFEACKNLTSVTIPNSVTSIGDSAFRSCTSLTSVTIGNSVTSIGNYAFYNCDSLKSITIPDSVTSIGNYAFMGCNSLEYNEYNNACYLGNKTNPYVVLVTSKNEDITSVNIHEKTKFICEAAFINCNSLASITIPNSVIKIPSQAFACCTSLTSVTIPDSVTTIGDHAFDDCSSLTSVTIGNSVTSIGNYAFSGCSNLTRVTIPNSVTSIGDYAFYYCTRLTIYCEAASQPSGWRYLWNYYLNSSNLPVVWGYKET